VTSTVEGTSRVTIVAPGTQMDLVLPADIPLADLLPTLLRHAGDDLADDGVDHQGWVLRRLGGAPLDTGRTAVQLDIRDGEVLYLAPRAEAVPEVVFDDVVDAVASATQQRAGRWGPADTRRFAVGLATAALLAGLAAVLLAVPPQLPGALIAGGLGLVLLTVAALVSRLGGDSRTGAVFALVGTAYGGAAGLLLLGGDRALSGVAAPDLLMAATFLVVYGALATLAVGDYPQVFLGTGAAGIALGAAAGISLVFGASPAVAAAVVGTAAFATIPAHPMLSYRIAGIPIPAIPTGPEDLKSDSSTVDGRRVLALADRAAEYLSGLAYTVGVVVFVSVVLLVVDGGWQGLLLAVLLSVLLMLRARPVPGRSHRLPVLIAGSAGLGVVAAAVFADADLGVRLGLVLTGTIGVAAISAAYGLLVSARRTSPVWGRMLDIVEILMIVALVPIAAWVARLYGWVATISG
jgi:type VII secretion integral membrane protein EccD